MDRRASSDLLRNARQGSAEALNDLFGRFAGKLLQVIRIRMGRELRSHVESQDILQASLLKAFRRIDQFDSSNTGSLMAWLARIAENEIRDQVDYHHRRRRDVAQDQPLDEANEALVAELRSQASQLILSDEMKRLEQALGELDEAYREIILLRKLEELSFKEIGQRLSKSPDACRMLLARAMTALTLKIGASS